MNSYMFDHGTWPAEIPRVITPITWKAAPRNVVDMAMPAARRRAGLTDSEPEPTSATAEPSDCAAVAAGTSACPSESSESSVTAGCVVESDDGASPATTREPPPAVTSSRSLMTCPSESLRERRFERSIEKEISAIM